MPDSQPASITVSGQSFSLGLIQRINDVVAEDPSLSRAQLAIQVCQWLDWNDPKGKPQNSSANVALRKLADRGLITLPPKRFSGKKPAPKLPKDPVAAPHSLPKTLRGIKDLRIVPVNATDNPEGIEIWNWLMINQHPQGDKPIMGRQVRYLIESDHGVLGAASFSAAAWRLSARDEFIGWSEPAREDNLQRVVSMSRFLIREEVRIDNLASHLLGLFARELPEDWVRIYGEKPLLLESFIDPAQFSGSCYRAANWIFAGQTKGRGRQDRKTEYLSTKKDIYLYALASGWKSQLCASPRAPEEGALQSLDYHTGLGGGETGWANPEFENTELGDKRYSSRAAQIAEKRFLNPSDGGVSGLGEKALIKSAYRFYESPRKEITIDNILNGHFERTTRRMAAHEVVLHSQDTTRLNYDGLQETTGLGAMSGNQTGHQAQGLHLHSTMALTTTGIPLGLSDVQCWARITKEEKEKRRQIAESIENYIPSVEEEIQEKESCRWLHSYEVSDAIAQRVEGLTVVNVSDREGDIYKLFAEANKPHRKAHLLVRANHNRALESEGASIDSDLEQNREQAERESVSIHLWPHLKNQPVAGTIELNLPKNQTRPKRKASVEVRYAKITLKAPTKKQANLPLHAVYVSEPSPEKGVSPVEWMLLTTMEVTSAEQALEIVRWYCQRWKIEELHRVIKSGCRIEDKQLKTAEALKRAIAIDLVVGWRILLLTKLSREHPDLPASVAFSPSEIEVSKILRMEREGTKGNPAKASSKKNGVHY